jgi:hypothetical protein
MVTHDGTFVSPAKIATEELWFMNHDVRIIHASRQGILLFADSAEIVQRHFLGGAG